MLVIMIRPWHARAMFVLCSCCVRGLFVLVECSFSCYARGVCCCVVVLLPRRLVCVCGHGRDVVSVVVPYSKPPQICPPKAPNPHPAPQPNPTCPSTTPQLLKPIPQTRKPNLSLPQTQKPHLKTHHTQSHNTPPKPQISAKSAHPNP